MLATGRTVVVLGRAVPLDPRLVLRIVRDEIERMPRALRAWFAFLLGVLGLAGIAALIALPPGWEVLGTSPTVEWGLLIVGYVFFAIMTSGLCLASSLGTVFGIDRYRPLEKRHAILAVLSLTAAFGIIALDLHFPVRLVFGAVLSPAPTSPMWWMGVFYGAYLLILLVEVWSMFTAHPSIHNWACTAAACMAVLAPSTLGAVFGVLGARALWEGPLSVALMVASAFLAGTSLLAVVFALVSRLRLAGHERASRLAVPGLRVVLAVGLALVGLLVAAQVTADPGTAPRGLRGSLDLLLAGDLAPLFWVLRVGVGFVVPAVLVVAPWTRGSGWLGLAGACALTGVFADRLLFVLAGQLVPVTTTSGVATHGIASYVPSPVEILIVVGAAAYVALGYTLAERYVDLRESDVHVATVLVPIVAALRRSGARLATVARPAAVAADAVDETVQAVGSPAAHGAQRSDSQAGPQQPGLDP